MTNQWKTKATIKKMNRTALVPKVNTIKETLPLSKPQANREQTNRMQTRMKKNTTH